MWSTIILILISLVNSASLTLTIWAGLSLNNTDWWMVFLIVFLMGALYQVDYFRRNISTIASQSNNGPDVELNELPRPAAAHVPARRGTSRSGLFLQPINTPIHRRTASAVA